MDNKIIEFVREEDLDHSCLTCGEKNQSTIIKIKRLHTGDTITSFCICNACIAKMQRDIETCE